MVWLNRVLVGRPAKGGKNGNEYGYFFNSIGLWGQLSGIYVSQNQSYKRLFRKDCYLFWNEYDSVVHEWHLFVFWKNSRRRHSGIRISRIFVESALLVIHYNYSQVANGQSKGAVQ